MVSKQRNTYSDWATEIGLLEGKTFSKQALNERMRPETEQFVKGSVTLRSVKNSPQEKAKK